MMELLDDLNRHGYTIIIITHSMWVACQYAKRTVLVNNGEILMDDLTRKVFRNEEILMKNKINLKETIDYLQGEK